MSWPLYVLIAIFLFVFSTYVDKFLLTRYFKDRQAGVLILFSCFFAVLVVPIIYFIDPTSVQIPLYDAFWLVLGGLLNIGAIIMYLYAMYTEEVSVVAPLFQMMPIFNYTLGYFFLGETLQGHQLIGFLVVLVGTILVSLDLKMGFHLKAKTFLTMATVCLLLAINTVIFKTIARANDSFWGSQFWQYVALLVAGSILLVFVRRYRQEFFAALKENSLPIIALNAINETTGVIGFWLISYAGLLAPIALVSVFSSTQPLFLFFFGALFTIFLPHIAKEDLSRKVIVQKIVAAAIIFAGVYLIEIGLR